MKLGLDTIIGKIDDVNLVVNGIYDGLTGVLYGINKEDGLKNGSNAMKAGLNTLDYSTTKLTEANTQLTEASSKISEGAGKLSNGISQFNTEIGKVINGNLSQVASRAKALIKLSEDYKSFTETNEEINGKVKFIMMTDKLRKED